VKKIIVVLFLILAGVIHLTAQQVSKKKPVADKPVAAPPATEADSPAFFLFPEFYSFWPVDKNDTILKYECLDQKDSLINADTLSNIDEVKSILLVKTYIDYTRTYIDPDGRPQPMPVTTHIYRYDKDGKDTWMGKSYATNGYLQLKEFRDDIVRADTTAGTNPLTGNKQLTIRKYYKVEPVSQ
jgi:hypothetical protein